MLSSLVMRVSSRAVMVGTAGIPFIGRRSMTMTPLSVRFASTGRTFLQEARSKGGASGWTHAEIGRVVLGVSSLGGIGGLCYYGLGMAGEAGTIEYSHLWPSYIKERVQKTFLYFGGGLAITAASAAALYSTGAMKYASTNPMAFAGISFLGTIGFMLGTTMTKYESTFQKHVLWSGFNGCMGLSLVPMAMMGGPLLARAAIYTGITIAGLTAVAFCAPNEEFLKMGGALSLGLGVIVVSSLGSFFLPAGSAMLPMIHSISLYGGLVIFGGFVLYDTQKIIYHAEQGPEYPYDPINESIGIYMDAINLFVRIAQIISSDRRK